MTTESGEFLEEGFWGKLRKFAVQAGKEVVEQALTLYYAAQRPETPLWAKTVIYSALAYFVLPTDAIPDLAPFVGYADDLGTLAAALTTVAMCISELLLVFLLLLLLLHTGSCLCGADTDRGSVW